MKVKSDNLLMRLASHFDGTDGGIAFWWFLGKFIRKKTHTKHDQCALWDF